MRAAETGLRINTKKTKVLKSNTKIRADLTVNDQNLEVDSFTYLGSEVENLGGSRKDVKFRIGKVRTAFRDRPFNLQGGGGMVFCFVQKTRELEY
jgi:hypothetical protein